MLRKIARSARRTGPQLLLAAGLALAPGGTAAQQDLAGRPIRGIDVAGDTALTSDTLLYYLGIERGQAFDPQALNDSIHRLWQRQLIDDLEVDAQPEGDGVRLRLVVTDRPILRSIVYEGLDKVSRTDITDRMAVERIQLVEGSPLARGEVERLQSAIEALYAERGFRLAQADYEIEEVAQNERRVVFTLDEGNKVRIEDIAFEGNSVFGDRRLRRAMKQTKETGLIARIRKRDIYNPATLAEDLQAVRDVYRNEGYKNVHVGEPQPDVRALRPNAEEPENRKRRLFLTIPVEEGERWKMGSIEIEGNEKFKDDQVLALFERPGGDWLRANRIDEFVERVTEAYNNSGFIQAQVQPELVEREDRVADVVIHVAEDEQYKVGRMEFDGNNRTRDKVLRREMLIQETRVFNTGALRTSLRRLGQLQYWEVDEDDPVGLEVNPEDNTVDVTVRGEEGDRTELQFGAGWSEIYGFEGQFMVRSRNFLGRGETFGVSFSSGEFSDSFDLSYSAPWFLDKPQSIGGQVFRRELDFEVFGQRQFSKTTGGTLSYGRNLGAFGSAGISGTYFESEGDQEFTFAGETLRSAFTRTVASIRPAYTFDSRDNPLFPTRGMRFNAGVDYSTGDADYTTSDVLDGPTDFVRPEIEFSLWQPLSRQPLNTVWGAHVRAGWLEPVSDGAPFPTDLFFLGGEQTMRGFDFRSISVRNEDGELQFHEAGYLLGGDQLFLFNTEFHLILGEPFRLLGFFDAGNVWSDELGQSMSLDDLRMSAGVELRIFVPILGAPLRFIWAENLDPLTDVDRPDEFESFQFSIGTTF